jgi:hypothetical protein
MKCNVGGMDMTARLIIGAVLLVVGLAVPLNAIWQTVVLVLAAIALLTGVLSYCPLNTLLGLNTCRPRNEQHKTGGQQG